MKNLNLPNKLTVLRLILTPILVFLLLLRFGYTDSNVVLRSGFLSILSSALLYLSTVILFIFIALTDFLDGYIARRDNLVTNFGKLMDPIADKIFVFSILIVLVRYNLLSVWFVLILLSREFVVVAIRTLIVENGGEIVAASNVAKLKTATQMLAILFIILFSFGKIANSIVMLPSVILSLISMYEYYKMGEIYLWKDNK
ncbi:CDP-diacylglycerol--glycerol-3-phosphate 3-phosphatidyltransferase [Pseudostreptobacillus sp.]